MSQQQLQHRAYLALLMCLTGCANTTTRPDDDAFEPSPDVTVVQDAGVDAFAPSLDAPSLDAANLDAFTPDAFTPPTRSRPTHSLHPPTSATTSTTTPMARSTRAGRLPAASHRTVSVPSASPVSVSVAPVARRPSSAAMPTATLPGPMAVRPSWARMPTARLVVMSAMPPAPAVRRRAFMRAVQSAFSTSRSPSRTARSPASFARITELSAAGSTATLRSQTPRRVMRCLGGRSCRPRQWGRRKSARGGGHRLTARTTSRCASSTMTTR